MGAIVKAKERGIKFDKDLTTSGYFDVVVFRGTIQHVDTPFLYMKQAYQALKAGGHIVFLMTPNTNCMYYWLWQSFPCWNPDFEKKQIKDIAGGAVFYTPSDLSLCSALQQFGFTIKQVQYPYWGGPYASPVK